MLNLDYLAISSEFAGLQIPRQDLVATYRGQLSQIDLDKMQLWSKAYNLIVSVTEIKDEPLRFLVANLYKGIDKDTIRSAVHDGYKGNHHKRVFAGIDQLFKEHDVWARKS